MGEASSYSRVPGMNWRGLSFRTRVEFVDTLGKMATGFRIARGWERCKECRIEENLCCCILPVCRFKIFSK